MGAQPGALIGPYRILDQIGEGGMGQVFAAVHEGTGQEVALKLLLKEKAEERQIARRFDREYTVLAALQHRNIVKVFAWDRPADGVAYLAMERLHGISLREWSRCQGRPAEVKAALAIGRQLADAMSEVHEHGIVHRDLKPDNVMLLDAEAGAPEGHVIKVLDFGIAKVPAKPTGEVDTQVLTAAGTVLGTLGYMPPEQCLNVEAIDAAADVYALGVVLFELLAGRMPFVSSDAADLIRKHCRDEPPFLGELVPDAPPDVGVLIASMLAKDPKERPSMRRCCARLEELGKDDRSGCPLPGLQPFAEADAELFFGRRADIDSLVDRLKLARVGDQRWVLLEGPSGAGKSSLVQAGIRPRLEDDRGPDGSRWLIACMRPSDDPLRALAQALVDALSGSGLEQTPEEVLSALRNDPDALRSFAAHTPRGSTLLLIIEQMEELFTLGTLKEASFDALLHAALVDQGCPLRLLTTLRTDFFHCLDHMPKLASMLNNAAYKHHLSPMDEEALKKVVQGIAQRAGLDLDESLSGRMVRDAASTGCPLPLLGHTLRALWSPQGGAPVSLEERYEKIGGAGGALANQAKAFLENLGEEKLERAKWMILDLVQVTRGQGVTRRSRSVEDVLVAGGKDATAEEVLRRLSGVRVAPSADDAAELRLVVLSSRSGEEPSQHRVDLVHETLLSEVHVIARWIDRERLRLEQYADLEGAAAAWQQARCPTEGLPAGALLEHYRGSMKDERRRELLERMVSERARQFLKEAEDAERRRLLREQAAEEADRRRRSVKRAMTIAIFVFAVAVAVFAAYAFQQSNIAERNLHSFISTTDEVISDIDWDLGRKSGNAEIRDQQLNGIDKALHSLSPSELEKPDVRLVVIKTKHRYGDFALNDGTLAAARERYTKAREELEENGERALADERWAFYWALNDSKLGKVALAGGHLGDARRYFADALRGIIDIKWSGDDYVRTLATSYYEQGELELADERPREALRYYGNAVEQFERIENQKSEDDDGRYNQSLHAEALGARAGAARQCGDLMSANIWLGKAIEIARPLADDRTPGKGEPDAYYRAILARIYIELAELRYQEKKIPDATTHFEAARALGEVLVKGDPTRKPYALIWGDALRGLEQLATDGDDHEVAVKLRGERYKLADRFLDRDPDDARFQRLGEP